MNAIRFCEICWEDLVHVLLKTSPTISREVRKRERRCLRNPADWFNKLEHKAFAREWVEELGVRTPKLYFQSKTPDDLPALENLPPFVVLKPSLGASKRGVFVLDQGVNRIDGQVYTRDQIVEHWNSDQKIRNNPQVTYMAEQFILQEGQPREIAWDYKFHMFGEKIALINMIKRRDQPETVNLTNLYDENWTPVNKKIYPHSVPGPPTPPPKCFDEMKEFVKRLGRELNCFMRIDMYACDEGAVFGEFTPFPHGKGRWNPRTDQFLGSLWRGKEGVS